MKESKSLRHLRRTAFCTVQVSTLRACLSQSDFNDRDR